MKNLVKENSGRLDLLTAAYLPLVTSGKKSATDALKEINFILGMHTKCITQDRMLEVSIQLVKAELTQSIKATKAVK